MKNERFFTKLDWAAFWTAGLLAFAVYFFTLGPSVGLEDSGELATAGAHLGVPHPPGYPFWTLCSWIFCKVFFWVTYMGHPTPAWAISCFSAVAGALAAACTAMLICRSSRDFITEDGDAPGVPGALAFGGGVAGALTFALSPVEWSQSTIVEIYSLNALFLMWVFLLSYRWMRSPSDKTLFFTAFVFGLGLTNYQVLLFAIVPLAIIIAMRNIGLFRDVFVYLIPAGLTWQLLKIGCLYRAEAAMSSNAISKHMPVLSTTSCPSGLFVTLAVVLVIAALVYAAVKRDGGEKTIHCVLWTGGAGAVLMFAGATIFTTSNTWEGVSAAVAPLVEPSRYAVLASFALMSVVSAAASALSGERYGKWFYASIAFSVAAIFCALAVPQAGDLGYHGVQFPWAKSTLVFISLVAALFAICAFLPKGLSFAIPVAGLHIALFILLGRGAMNGLTHPCSWWFWWPVVWNFILLALAWITLPNGRSVAGAVFFTQLGVSFYVYMPIVSDLRNPPMNWGYPRTWEGFKHALMRAQYEAIGVPSFHSVSEFFSFVGKQMMHYLGDVRVQFTDLLLFFVPVAFVSGHWVVSARHRKTFWQWMGAAAACFMMMSLLLILLANVKGDIQDGFIQKVKFISSHAMIALWIGYGLVFAGALALKFLVRGAEADSPCAVRRGRSFALGYAAVAVVVAFAYPVIQNWTDDRMVFELGGCEQNGHTFGWQFGAYQLEGASAIEQQLVADEEPLPDPSYPPAMEKHALFFGGTDPGRFVPTYMIYSADYRPDVYLITQNALADDTYMSVERDLYGDEIWIPSKEDSAEAFNIYVDEVQRGVRPANGDLKIENGRVQVTGALGVMEINGILTKMMFDHEKANRAFYIEESYVIPWMYAYLVPHGLVMKIEKDPCRVSEKRAAQDADFWDWYVRRLLDDPMYRRDFAAQKSFSKLRSAIAGLHAREHRMRDASQAYREACLLYPISPEAVFRYAQETLLPRRRWDVVLELMDMTDALDPNNRRTKNMREYVTRTKQMLSAIAQLEPKLRAGKLDDASKLSLATCYYSIGRVAEAGDIMRHLVDKASNPHELRTISRILMDANLSADAETALRRYLTMQPQGDHTAWLDLARLQFRSGRREDAERSFVMAYRVDGKTTFATMQRDQELQQIAAPLFEKGKRK